jgi:hypothetical protein
VSIFSSIGHALSTGYHDVTNLFGGGSNNNVVTTTTTTQAPIQRPTQSSANATPLLNKPSPMLNPTTGQPLASLTQLQKPQQPTTQTTTQAPNPTPAKPGFFSRVGHQISRGYHDATDVAEGAAGVGAGAALGTLRAGEGLVEGVTDIPKVAVDVGVGGGNLLNKAIGAPQVHPQFQKDVDQWTNDVNKPQDWLAGKTDQAVGMFNHENGDSTITGRIAADIYHPVQVAANVATVIPAAETGLSKLPVIGSKLGKVGDFIETQKSLPTLQKAANLFKPTATEDAVSEGASAAQGSEVAEGVSSANPTQAADAAEQTSQVSTNEGAPTTVEPAGSTAPTGTITAPNPASPSDTAASVREPVQPTPSTPPALSPADTGAPVETPVDNTPAYLRKAAAQQADAQARAEAEANAGNLGAGESPLDRPTFQHNQDIQGVISDGEQQLNEFLAEHPSATMAEVEQAQQSIREQVLNKVQDLQNARIPVSTDAVPASDAAAAVAKGEPITPVADVNGNPAIVTPETIAKQAEAAGVSPNVGTAPTNPAEIQAAQAATAPVAPEAASSVPQGAADATTGGIKSERHLNTVINNTQNDGLKQAYEASALAKNNPAYGDLMDAAQQTVASKDLPTIIEQYGQDVPITNAQQYYERLQALMRLEQTPDVPEAQEAAANALKSMTDFESNNGYNLGATRIAYDNMPTTMKVNYIKNLVVKAGGDLNEADMKRLYSAAELQGSLAADAQQAENAVYELGANAAKDNPEWNAQMQDALGKERDAQAALGEQNRAVVDILTKNLPNSPIGDRVAQSARTMMLSSVGGRGFAIIGAGANLLTHLADSALSSTFGRVVNAARRVAPGDASAVKVSYDRPGTLIKGAVRGVKGLARDTFGSPPVKSVDSYLKKPYDSEYSHDSTRYGFVGQHITAPLRKVIRFGVGSHLALTQGVEDAAIEQAARQSAAGLGVPKENLGSYIDFYKAHPPEQVANEAKQAWLAVNNLHKNGVSDALGKVASGIESLAAKGGKGGDALNAVAQQIRTVFMPFSHYMGGFVNKALTDRNMFYNAYKMARASSPQEFTDQLAKLTTNVGTATGAGYMLAKTGVITNKDQDGNSYDGLYFHIGNRYIPVAIAGQAAMPIIMGAELHNSTHGGGNWATNVVDDTLKATGVAGTFGDTTSTGALLAGDSGRGVPQIVGTAVRQHIPGFFGDINSGLDYSGLNPTHEKPLTKATTTNPATGRDVTNVTQTEVNKTKAAIPVIDQSLPRDTGKQAHDFLDRILHSGQSSSSQRADAATLVKQQSQSQADLAAGIPDPNGKYDTKKGESFDGAVKNAIDNNEYDKAIPALQQKLASYGNDNKVDPATTTNLKKQIAELQVTKQYGADGQTVAKLYKDTSLSDWRDMGDPTSDKYDPNTYKLLWHYDGQLKSNSAIDKQKFSEKTLTSKEKAAAGASTIKDNTISSTPNLATISLGDLVPRKVTSTAAIPTIQQILPSQLIKPRAISVSPVR